MAAGVSQSHVGRFLGWVQPKVSLFERTHVDDDAEARMFIAAIEAAKQEQLATGIGAPLAKIEAAVRVRAAKAKTGPKPRAELRLHGHVRAPSNTSVTEAMATIDQTVAAMQRTLPPGWTFAIQQVEFVR